MSEQEDHISKATKKVHKKTALVTFPFKIIIGIVKLMLWVLSIYLVVYFILWSSSGYDYTYALLQKNYDYLAIRVNQQNSDLLFINTFHSAAHLVQVTSLKLIEYLGGAAHSDNMIKGMDNILTSYQPIGLDGSGQSILSYGAVFLIRAISIISMAILISLMKLITSLSLITIYVLAIVLGILTGNRKRLYRRIVIDRESGAKHKIVKYIGGYLPLCVIVLYLVLPFNFSPLLVFLLVGMISVMLFYMMVSTFRKYL
ncbi:DUF4400 domain-containing protein [Fangia hongkongensis]|uniref:DUF4400 domain-containing protein n=1 Tax=Fangia hongkongensis TaxID=270495 RepID=UPI00036E1AF8|nr:DUF4400 domain-containing protein [Fangia hongkongensis]MBK2126287.1 DUF4400 domain-containing protein [Fangia hongkongensis]